MYGTKGRHNYILTLKKKMSSKIQVLLFKKVFHDNYQSLTTTRKVSFPTKISL